MDPTDVAFVKGAVAFVLLAGTGLSAMWIWMRARGRTLTKADRDVVEALRAENARVQSELETRIAALEEHVDFTDRLLNPGRATHEMVRESPRTP